MTGDKRNIFSPKNFAPKNRPSFTLMEALVAMGIFIMLVGAFGDIYMHSSRAAQQIALRAKLQSDARFVMEAMVREIRAYNIDYAAYGGGGDLPAIPMDELKLINPNGLPTDTIVIKRENSALNCPDAQSTPCITVSVGGGAPAAITPKGTRLEYLNFYPDPPRDPFALYVESGTYSASSQPRVTVVMGLRGLSARAEDEWVFNVQTTVTPRLYLR